jgi:hypothetical protein
MGHIAGTTFGIGTPTTFPVPAISWGVSPYAGQAFGAQPFPSQPYVPFSNQSIAGQGIGAGQALPQMLQLLQIVPQQLQQLQVLQQQQLLQLQQLLQVVPAQLQQLQQLIQFVPQQVQYLQQQQPFGSAISGGFGLVPQAFAGQGASYVM